MDTPSLAINIFIALDFALNGKSFGEKANISNEKGIYMGFKTAFNNKWSLSLYTDFYTFPWLRYSTASPIRGKDIAVKLKCKLNKKNDFYFRFHECSSKIDIHENIFT